MNTNYVLLGCLGGLIPDVIRLIKVGDTGIYQAPDYLKSWFFYLILLLQVALGGFLVSTLDIQGPLQALVYGYAGPQIFTSLAAGVITRTETDANKPQNPDFAIDGHTDRNHLVSIIKSFY